jgi:2-dehydro-3-deoxygalactonokinase
LITATSWVIAAIQINAMFFSRKLHLASALALVSTEHETGTTMKEKAAWIAIDWGTSHLRAWAMNNSDEVLEKRTSDRGMGSVDPGDFEGALLDVIREWLDESAINLMACGMVGARQGWREADYLAAPTQPLGGGFTRPTTKDARLNVHILPGLKQDIPADVMRGEETQIAGFLAQNPDFDGIVCLPGTHTKWVHVSAKEVVSFQTFMTGELFALLSEHSVLRHCVGGHELDEQAFCQAINDCLSQPEKIAARLFSLRAETLLSDLGPAQARSRLSGLLIGAELAAARAYWLGQSVVLIGDPKLNAIYALGLKLQGVNPTQIDGDAVTLNGLIAAHKKLQESLT